MLAELEPAQLHQLFRPNSSGTGGEIIPNIESGLTLFPGA